MDDTPAYRELAAGLKQGESRAVSLLDAAKPYFLAALYHKLRLPLLVVTAQPEHARQLYEQLVTWCADGRVRLYPELDTLFYDRVVSDSSGEAERLQALSALADSSRSEPPLVVASAAALMQKTTPYTDFASTSHTVRVNRQVDPLKLIEQWQKMGYRLESTVEVPGSMSRRGGIVDIYPATAEQPARLEFFGNTIESIRLFDPVTQRSLRSIEEFAVSPATEVLTPLLHERAAVAPMLDIDLTGCTQAASEQYRSEMEAILERRDIEGLSFYAPFFNTGSLLDYLPQMSLLVLDEPETIQSAVKDIHTQAE